MPVWRRQLRWLAGFGWSAEDFAGRYAAGGADSWGYARSAEHLRRADFILGALPAARFAKALEVGCAQGFLSRRLAERVDRLIACDISERAVRQARENCRDNENVEFRVADIRAGFPGGEFDLCLFSDVVYYLSRRETDAVLHEAAAKTASGGFLLISNEWRDGARGLTSPAHAFARLDGAPDWERVRQQQLPFGAATLQLAIYRRVETVRARHT